MTQHEVYMKQAIKQAQKALKIDEVPIGCVIVYNGKIISRAYNKKHNAKDSTYHAEILAIRKACKKIGDWRLTDCDIYATLEPCAMCAGACVNSRIKTIYYGATDPASGCCGSLIDITSVPSLNHKCEAVGGILEDQCSKIITDFFKAKRKK